MKCARSIGVMLAIYIVLFIPVPLFALTKDPLSVRLPAIEIMPEADWYWVGERMALNGLPMAVKMFTYTGKSQDVTRYYQSYWKTMGHGKQSERTLGSKIILGFELDGFYHTVQFEEVAGVVQGKAVVTPTPLSYKASKKTLLPVPPRSSIHSKVESFDTGRREETLSAESNFDVGYVVDFYKAQLVDDGWFLFSSSGDLRNSAVLSFQRNGELLQLTAKGLQHNNSQKTQFLIHWLK